MKTLWSRVRSGAGFCFLVMLSAVSVFGQTASISGRVTDPTGAAIGDAPVTIKNTGTSSTQTVNSDAQGRYNVPDLPIGTYDVSASKTGFQSAVRTGVT